MPVGRHAAETCGGRWVSRPTSLEMQLAVAVRPVRNDPRPMRTSWVCAVQGSRLSTHQLWPKCQPSNWTDISMSLELVKRFNRFKSSSSYCKPFTYRGCSAAAYHYGVGARSPVTFAEDHVSMLNKQGTFLLTIGSGPCYIHTVSLVEACITVSLVYQIWYSLKKLSSLEPILCKAVVASHTTPIYNEAWKDLCRRARISSNSK